MESTHIPIGVDATPERTSLAAVPSGVSGRQFVFPREWALRVAADYEAQLEPDDSEGIGPLDRNLDLSAYEPPRAPNRAMRRAKKRANRG